ncbi:MAG: hypothetical protein FJX76_00930 [Armatimonadetes bacterium]|nr:hypothetical protein [Armatimonadota bacterium]
MKHTDKKSQFKLEVTNNGPRFVLVGEPTDATESPATLAGATEAAPLAEVRPPASPPSPAREPLAEKVEVAARPGEVDSMEIYLSTAVTAAMLPREAVTPPAREEEDLARPLTPPPVRDILEGRAGETVETPAAGKAGRGKRPMSKNKRKEWESARRGDTPRPAAPEVRAETVAARPQAAPEIAPAKIVPAPRPEPTVEEEPIAPSRAGGPLVVSAPTLADPRVLSSVVSTGTPVDAQWQDTTPLGPEIVDAPAAAAAPVLAALPAPRSERMVADPTPRDMVETSEPLVVPAPGPAVPKSAAPPAPTHANARQSRPAPRRDMSSMLLLALLVGVVVLVFARTQQAPKVAVQPQPAPTAQAPHSRLFANGVDEKLMAQMKEGNYVVVGQDGEGALSTALILDALMAKDLAEAQRLARIKAEQLEQTLFIAAVRNDNPVVIDVVKPTDRRARLAYMMTNWKLKQHALGWPRERYMSRAALDPNRTLVEMAAFVREHPDSRLAAQALEDMRYVSYYVLQDPSKFRNVMLAMLDDSFRWAREANRSTSAPELANVIGPFLKESMNQWLFQVVHRRFGKGGVAEDIPENARL